MIPFIRARLENGFTRFLLVGGMAAAVNIGSRFFLSMIVNYSVAIVIAYLIGMTTAWAMFRVFVFSDSGRAKSVEYIRFAIVNGLAIAQTLLVSLALADYVFPAVNFEWRPGDVAHVIGVIVPVFTSYLGHKYFSFAPAK